MKTQTILILAGLGIVGFYFYNKSKNKTNDTPPPPATTPNATKGKIVKRVVQKATAMQNFAKTK